MYAISQVHMAEKLVGNHLCSVYNGAQGRMSGQSTYEVTCMAWDTAATLAVFTQIPRVYDRNHWTWEDDEEMAPVYDYVYTARDLERAMLTYGTWVSRMLLATGPPHFRLLGMWLPGTVVIASYYWRWETYVGRYLPDDEPWCVWELTERFCADQRRTPRSA